MYDAAEIVLRFNFTERLLHSIQIPLFHWPVFDLLRRFRPSPARTSPSFSHSTASSSVSPLKYSPDSRKFVSKSQIKQENLPAWPQEVYRPRRILGVLSLSWLEYPSTPSPEKNETPGTKVPLLLKKKDQEPETGVPLPPVNRKTENITSRRTWSLKLFLCFFPHKTG